MYIFIEKGQIRSIEEKLHRDGCGRVQLGAERLSRPGWRRRRTASLGSDAVSHGVVPTAIESRVLLARSPKQDLLERASISIAKGNYNMLRDNRTLPAG